MSSFITVPTANYSMQRVGLFVDVQNLYYSAKALYKSRVNFEEIMREGVDNRNLIRAHAYAVKADSSEENQFFDALKRIGFDLRLKDLQVFYGGQKKGDWDVGISMDIMRLASKLDVIVLASGDGDFTELLVHARSLGCRVEVMAFRKSASSQLLEVADRFVDLGEDDQFIMSSKKVGRQVAASQARRSRKPGPKTQPKSKK